MGCKTFVHKSNTRNISALLSLSQLEKCFIFFIMLMSFLQKELEIRAEQVLPGSERLRGEKVGEE
jgi:hypothetical protein